MCLRQVLVEAVEHPAKKRARASPSVSRARNRSSDNLYSLGPTVGSREHGRPRRRSTRRNFLLALVPVLRTVWMRSTTEPSVTSRRREWQRAARSVPHRRRVAPPARGRAGRSARRRARRPPPRPPHRVRESGPLGRRTLLQLLASPPPLHLASPRPRHVGHERPARPSEASRPQETTLSGMMRIIAPPLASASAGASRAWARP